MKKIQQISRFLNNQYQYLPITFAIQCSSCFNLISEGKVFFSSNPGQFALVYNHIAQALIR